MNFLAFTFTLIASSLILGWLFYNTHMAFKGRPGKTVELLFAALGLAAIGTLVYTNWAQLGSFFAAEWWRLPGFILAWDVLLFVALSSFLTVATLEVLNLSRNPRKVDPFRDRGDEDYKDRTYYVNLFNYAAAALKDASSSYITAVSILIPASFVIVQVSKSASPPAGPGVIAAMPLVFRAVVWFLFSLLFGVLALHRVFTHGRHEELSRSAPALILLGLQLISLFTGLLQLAAGLYSVVFGGSAPPPAG
jgi:hypothetical protein